MRADMAGIPGFHPHVLRHTAASRWLAAGGSEGGMMAVAGWSQRDMIDRYTRATAKIRRLTPNVGSAVCVTASSARSTRKPPVSLRRNGSAGPMSATGCT
jgi:hypothetical protein